jgi:xylan 1,4-beta-xylosidase
MDRKKKLSITKADLVDALRSRGTWVDFNTPFRAQIKLNRLPAANPFDPELIGWWKEKTAEVCRLIHDFGSILVRADSEEQPDIQDYSRTPADGACNLTDAVEPCDRIVLWRTFVHDNNLPDDPDTQACNKYAQEEYSPEMNRFWSALVPLRIQVPVLVPVLFRVLVPLLVAILLCSCRQAKEESVPPLTFCNPMNLDYRYQADPPSRREAADPTVILFKDKYFLFASKSGGYWWSDDLCQWNLVETTELPVEEYAPTAVAIGDTVYFMASSARKSPVYKSTDPVSGEWKIACDTFPFPVWDPALFLDDDERLYLYWGCSNENPIYGIELDYRNRFHPLGKAVELIHARPDIHGWERPGDRNELERAPWIEGAWMNKQMGVYHLQYAAPGTEFKSYADGVYTSVNPLGPFRYSGHNPFSLKAGGFSCGAGHGSTFTDKYGNLWHIATVSISVNHVFERRLALFPAMFDEDNNLYAATGYGDYPFILPGQKIKDLQELLTGWMLLSVNKPVRASSSLDMHPPEYAVDEEIRTSWSAESGSDDDWISVDLEKEYLIHAIQVNFADVNGNRFGRDSGPPCRFIMEYSTNGQNWKTVDMQNREMPEVKSQVITGRTVTPSGREHASLQQPVMWVNVPHYYQALEKPFKARYFRLSNVSCPGNYFALSGLRIFGTGGYEKPGKVHTLNITRDEKDRARARVTWTGSPDATGYNLRYGISPEKLYHQHIVYRDTSLLLGSLNADTRYFFTIDAFNENGITAFGSVISLE